MTHTCVDHICDRPARTPSGLWARLWQARLVHAQRRALAQLSAAQLRDIGLTKDEAIAESQRAVWDVPHHWRS